MRISKSFCRQSPIMRSVVLPEVDNFTNTEFFFKGGFRLRDIDVFARADSNPELRRKVNEYIIERDIVSSSSDLSEEQILENLETKYNVNTALQAVRGRISDILCKEKEAAKES